MFLATTGLTEFWDTQEELLCLGPWCLRHDRRQEWEGLAYQLMPNPWDDRARFTEATGYLDTYGERLLSQLTDYLNAVHGASHGTRYWRILIGTWLIHYLHAAYDRYVHLTEAFSRYPSLRTTVLDPRAFQVPTDTLASVTSLMGDLRNLQLFSEQLAHMGYAFPQKMWERAHAAAPQAPALSQWRRAIREIRRRGAQTAEHTAAWIQRKRSHVALCEMSFARSSLWALAWQNRLRVIPREITWDRPLPIQHPVMDARRNGLATLGAVTAFERVAVQSLPQHLPTLYLEGYDRAREAIVHAMRRKSRVIVSATGWHHQEPFKLLAAEASAQGSRLVAVQHGGGYGLFRYSPLEQHERRAADTFLSWGWANGDAGDQLVNAPSPQLSERFMTRQARQIPHAASDALLFVSTAHLRYLLRFHSCPVGLHTPAYLQWQVQFLAAIPDRLRRVVRFRPYPEEFGYTVREHLTNHLGPLQWDDASRPLTLALQDARLVVVDHSGTTFLEVLRCGVPTVLFWDPRLSEVREEAEPYVEALRTAGILYDSPEAAAGHVTEVYEAPHVWWSSPSVQEARQRFIERYALGRHDWRAWWTPVLDRELMKVDRLVGVRA